MSLPFHAALAALLVFAGTAAADEHSAHDPIHFRFAPPDGVRMQQTVKAVHVRTVPGLPAQRLESEAALEARFAAVGDGYTYSPRVVAARSTLNGSEIDSPTADILAAVQPTFVISARGEVIAVEGLERIAAWLGENLPAEHAAALAAAFDEEAMVAHEKALWDARHMDLCGRSMRIGESVEGRAEYRLPDGSMLEYTVRTLLAGWQDCPAGRCVRVEQSHHSAPAGEGAQLSGHVLRVLDPATMLIYEEDQQRTLTLPAAGGSTEPVRVIDEYHYRHRYY